MNLNIIPVNSEALSRAFAAVLQPEQATLVQKAYQAIDAAMAYGYEQSQTVEAEKRRVMSEEYVAALGRSEDRDGKEAFDNGYKAGYVEGHGDRPDYDDGYVDGVSDARAMPAYADEKVAELCRDDSYFDCDPSEYTHVDDVDSGDEQPYEANDF